ncbi:mucin-5B-like [Petromyzon marinus]|uniref:mucin-5B-like n=1 Tax=Petromyzon marinus TaxID=7757 RepID=UPI003F6F70F3
MKQIYLLVCCLSFIQAASANEDDISSEELIPQQSFVAQGTRSILGYHKARSQSDFIDPDKLESDLKRLSLYVVSPTTTTPVRAMPPKPHLVDQSSEEKTKEAQGRKKSSDSKESHESHEDSHESEIREIKKRKNHSDESGSRGSHGKEDNSDESSSKGREEKNPKNKGPGKGRSSKDSKQSQESKEDSDESASKGREEKHPKNKGPGKGRSSKESKQSHESKEDSDESSSKGREEKNPKNKGPGKGRSSKDSKQSQESKEDSDESASKGREEKHPKNKGPGKGRSSKESKQSHESKEDSDESSSKGRKEKNPKNKGPGKGRSSKESKQSHESKEDSDESSSKGREEKNPKNKGPGKGRSSKESKQSHESKEDSDESASKGREEKHPKNKGPGKGRSSKESKQSHESKEDSDESASKGREEKHPKNKGPGKGRSSKESKQSHESKEDSGESASKGREEKNPKNKGPGKGRSSKESKQSQESKEDSDESASKGSKERMKDSNESTGKGYTGDPAKEDSSSDKDDNNVDAVEGSGHYTPAPEGSDEIDGSGSGHYEGVSTVRPTTEGSGEGEGSGDFFTTYSPPTTTTATPVVTPPIIIPPIQTPVCSTWGQNHFKTFDGKFFDLGISCNYLFASNCKDATPNFNVIIRRSVNNPQIISSINISIIDINIDLSAEGAAVNKESQDLPFNQYGIQIIALGDDVKITATNIGFKLFWNKKDSLLLQVTESYRNKTCGLCGDYNGDAEYPEFKGGILSVAEYALNNKYYDPMVQCDQIEQPPTPDDCSMHESLCELVLNTPEFADCKARLDVRPYIGACIVDQCSCTSDCPDFGTVEEYSRECRSIGGTPGNWRNTTPECLPGTIYQECGIPCPNSCSQPSLSNMCIEECVPGCFCPRGTIWDDLTDKGCIPLEECSCVFNKHTYNAGDILHQDCQDCVCHGGVWNCEEQPCTRTCALEGGSHIKTFDQNQFTFHGDCYYFMAMDCRTHLFNLMVKLKPCETKNTCLKSLALILGRNVLKIMISDSGEVSVNDVEVNLPYDSNAITIFYQSSFYIHLHTSIGVNLLVQLSPVMQLYLTLDPSFHTATCGLCGDYNGIQSDDFKTSNGLIEGTAIYFANSWKAQNTCPPPTESTEEPCMLSLNHKQYAEDMCSNMKTPDGPFSACHGTVSPEAFYKRCLYDTCSCQDSEACLCAALSSYALACASKHVVLEGWREHLCAKYTENCPGSQVYSYNALPCVNTCRVLQETGSQCFSSGVAVDGCTCPKGTYDSGGGFCMAPEECPCYYRGNVLPLGNSVQQGKYICECRAGTMLCMNPQGPTPQPCPHPMVYFNCNQSTANGNSFPCHQTCSLQECYNPECNSGCVCPKGLVYSDDGTCIQPEACPCEHNGQKTAPGESIEVDCNTCTCVNRKWECTNNTCLSTCSLYGQGHYRTFDGQRFLFEGSCTYVIAQDNCQNPNNEGTFNITTENVPCGTTGTTCSRSINVQVGNWVIKLFQKSYSIDFLGSGPETINPFQIKHRGLYLVVETSNRITLTWDKNTGVFISLGPEYKGTVCGLCGNHDGRAANDLTTRTHMVVEDPLEFGNSWKLSGLCADAKETSSPCALMSHRLPWAQQRCGILKSDTFASCHALVDVLPFHEACVHDACGCDTGGDCECLCNAVAVYAKACNEAGQCIKWRTPDLCPLFCEYYDAPDDCTWHYRPCGQSCPKTCRDPHAECREGVQRFEGCYPKCTESKPYFDEDNMLCVSWDSCGCFDNRGQRYQLDQPVPSEHKCYTCTCSESGISCQYNRSVCFCTHNGIKYAVGAQIDLGDSCSTAICEDGEILYHYAACTSSPIPTTTTVATTTPVITTSSLTTTSSSPTSTFTTPEPPTTTTATPVITTSSPSTPPSDCIYLNPPRKYQETWKVESCTIATCRGGSNVEMVSVQCPIQIKPQCVNGHEPKQVRDDDGCCIRYECECICSAWGDPHYTTFDGTYYTFTDDCTYVLVEQIIPVLPDFRVTVNNFRGCSGGGPACPRSITITYNGTNVIMETSQRKKPTVKFNGVGVTPVYSENGMTVASSGISTRVDIPEIEAVITFEYVRFSITLPYKFFFNNTQGQCGTCTNNRQDDCRMRNGVVDKSCVNMAWDWKVPDPSCKTNPSSSPPPDVTCPPHPLCNLIGSDLFAECKRVIDPQPFVMGCQFDWCATRKDDIPCLSIKAYASQCLDRGICVDWRNFTNNRCSYTCPIGKVYNACGPSIPPTCDTRYNMELKDLNRMEDEGCFCPEGTILHNSQTDICTTSCGCTGPNGYPKQYGDRWISNCLDCVCDEHSSSVVCVNHSCPPVPKPPCQGQGMNLVEVQDPSDACCTRLQCQCNSNLCIIKDIVCPVGYKTVVKMDKEDCCPLTECVQLNVCVLHSSSYEVGEDMPSADKCETCVCGHGKDVTRFHIPKCTPVPCNTRCALGYEYVENSGTCCGTCNQTTCIINLPHQSTIILQPSESWSPDNCTKYTCERTDAGILMTTVASITCPDFDPDTCTDGAIRPTKDGCCKECEASSVVCKAIVSNETIERNGCRSVEPMPLIVCEGACPTSSVYSSKTNSMMHTCNCCQEANTEKREVTLICGDNTEINIDYPFVTKCACKITRCSRP